MLGPLAADPSLRGLMDVFARFLDGVQRGQAKLVDFERPMARHRRHDRRCAGGKAASARLAHALHRLPADLRELRRFILVKPALDYSSLQPGSKASDAIRAACRDLQLTPDHGVRVRLTGSVPARR